MTVQPKFAMPLQKISHTRQKRKNILSVFTIFDFKKKHPRCGKRSFLQHAVENTISKKIKPITTLGAKYHLSSNFIFSREDLQSGKYFLNALRRMTNRGKQLRVRKS